MNYKFVLIDSSDGTEEAEWILTPPVVVGRCPTADITIGDVSISRRHCQFFVDPFGSLVVRDLGSKNGIYVAERRVEKSVVCPGSEVRIGRITLRLELTDEEIDDDTCDVVEVLDLDVDETQPMRIVDFDLEIGTPRDELH